VVDSGSNVVAKSGINVVISGRTVVTSGRTVDMAGNTVSSGNMVDIRSGTMVLLGSISRKSVTFILEPQVDRTVHDLRWNCHLVVVNEKMILINLSLKHLINKYLVRSDTIYGIVDCNASTRPHGMRFASRLTPPVGGKAGGARSVRENYREKKL
jgi:hypothetical protein